MSPLLPAAPVSAKSLRTASSFRPRPARPNRGVYDHKSPSRQLVKPALIPAKWMLDSITDRSFGSDRPAKPPPANLPDPDTEINRCILTISLAFAPAFLLMIALIVLAIHPDSFLYEWATPQ